MKILFLHGLESDGLKPEKRVVLEKCFNTKDIHAEVYDYKESFKLSYYENLVHKVKPDVIVGSSFGGRVAYYLCSLFGVRGVLFNPALESELSDTIFKLPKINCKSPHIHALMGASDDVVNPKLTIKYLEENTDMSMISIDVVFGCEHRISAENFERGVIGFLKQ